VPASEKGKRAAQNPQGESGANGRAGVMRLYLFEHCSISFRVRMAAALKHLHLQETVLLEDDSETMIKLVGKRVVPILVKDDGQPMLESLDMVAHVDGIGEPILVGPQRSELAAWASATADKTAPLTWPRYPLLGLPEFGTIAAHDHFVVRKRKRLGDLVELRARTRELVDALMPDLEQLDRLIESPTAVNGKLSLDDIRVLPLLRSAAVVKGLRFPQKVREYFETMMGRIGYQPLPAV
jgi:glutaredoxin 2